MEREYRCAVKFMAVMEKISTYQNIEPAMSLISGNPIITMAYVMKHPDKKWNWKGLTSNPSIPLAYIEKYRFLKWDQDEYEFRKYGGEAEEEQLLTCDYPDVVNETTINQLEAELQAQPDDVDIHELEEELWSRLSQNPNLTLEVIEEFYYKPWDYYVLVTRGFHPLTPLADAS